MVHADDSTAVPRARHERPVTHEDAPTVLIRTFPPTTNANYGGILQAYALQNAIEQLGVRALVDSSRLDRRLPGRRRRTTRCCSRVIRATIRMALPRPLVKRLNQRAEIERSLADSLTRFARERIPTVRLFDRRGRVRPDVLVKCDGFVAGSDQVWRPEFMNVASYLFDFLPNGDTRPRFSYAASFGTDRPSFDESERTTLGALAQRMDSISVRETSGVRVVRELWGVDAAQHVDPTMLLNVGEYTRIASEAPDRLPERRCVSYVLDQTPPTMVTVRDVYSHFEEHPVKLTRGTPSSLRELEAEPDLYRRPSVEAWLGAISGARFVVTDSFHGAVFSILYNVPFIAICNRERGAARFESLLAMFGLMDRMVEPGERVTNELVVRPIDWAAVNERVAGERVRALEYLRTALDPLLTNDPGRAAGSSPARHEVEVRAPDCSQRTGTGAFGTGASRPPT